MRKEIKEKRKSLSKNYSDFLFEVLQYIQKQNLSKYVYLKYRDEIIEDIYNAEQEGTDFSVLYKGGYERYFEKQLRKEKRKNVLEKISSFSFAFFSLFFALSLIIYLYHFVNKIEGIFFSSGIYLYVTSVNLAYMFIYGFLGSLLSIIIQKNDPKTKRILLIGTSSFGIVIVVTFIILGNYITRPLKLNMIVVLLVNALLGVLGYFVEDYISKKRCGIETKTKR